MEGVIDYMAAKAPEEEKQRILALKDVGPLHHLCKSLPDPVRGRPHPSQDLIQLFRLTDIAESVRRTDPVTGEKINKLRKSYVGKIKDFRISGRNEATSHPGLFVPHMMAVPEDDWANTFVRGKMPDTVTAAPDWSAKLKKSLEMAPGKLPPQVDGYLKNFLDIGEPIPKIVKPNGAVDPAKRLAPGAQPHATPPSPARGLARPGRSGAKRSYDDSSFTGYGDGFVDDEDGTDTDSRLGQKRKKPRTDYLSGSQSGAGSSQAYRSFT